MKQVINIVMADDENLREVETGGFLSINRVDDYEYEILLDGVKVDNSYSLDDAKDVMYKFAVYNDMQINGAGQYAGGKFFQLPDDLQEEVYKISRGGE